MLDYAYKNSAVFYLLSLPEEVLIVGRNIVFMRRNCTFSLDLIFLTKEPLQWLLFNFKKRGIRVETLERTNMTTYSSNSRIASFILKIAYIIFLRDFIQKYLKTNMFPEQHHKFSKINQF